MLKPVRLTKLENGWAFSLLEPSKENIEPIGFVRGHLMESHSVNVTLIMNSPKGRYSFHATLDENCPVYPIGVKTVADVLDDIKFKIE